MKRRLFLFVSSLCLATSAALAGPFYVGASVGRTGLELDRSGATFDSNATATKLYAGYRLAKLFGIEGGLVDFGSPDDTSSGIRLDVDAQAWDVFAVGVLPLGPQFELFAKAGLVRWDGDFELSGSVTESSSDTGYDPVYGAALKFGDHFAVRVEYERFDVSDVDRLNLTSIGVDLRF
jgi:OOP family OmpA-OmpF porin